MLCSDDAAAISPTISVFGCNHREAAALLAGACCLNRSISRQLLFLIHPR
jgi:hypothetical protein